MDSLPDVLQEQIAAEVATYGPLHLSMLRSCSHQWRMTCGAMMMATVSVDKLAESMAILNSRPGLDLLIIKSTTTSSARLKGDALSLLQAQLRAISLTSGCSKEAVMQMDLPLASGRCGKARCVVQTSRRERVQGNRKEFNGERGCTMVVEDLSNLLQPWYNSVAHMHLDHCHLIGMKVCKFGSPSVFANFPSLHTLRIISVQASTDAGVALKSFNLCGCEALQRLYFHENDFSDLDLYRCKSLVSIDCQNNQLVFLHLWTCASLVHVQCSHNNKLATISLDSDVDTLSCVSSGLNTWISGSSMLVDLSCSAGCLVWIQRERRQHLVRLSLLESCVVTKESGFRDLQYLHCSFGWWMLGSIDLTGCNAVELDCHCQARRLPIVGRDRVRKLSLTQLGSRQPDLVGFTAMQELNYTVHKQGSLSLLACTTVRKVRISFVLSKECCLASIDFSQCSLLEELCCDGFSTLTSLSLKQCTHLRSLTCTGSGLWELDASWCPLLTTLDVSDSLRLRVICKSACKKLLNIRSEGCWALLVTPVKRTAPTDLQTHPCNIAALYTQAASPAAQLMCVAPSQSKGFWDKCRNSLWRRLMVID